MAPQEWRQVRRCLYLSTVFCFRGKFQRMDVRTGEIFVSHNMQPLPLNSGRVYHRISGFTQVWERAVTAEEGRVGYLEMLRFCW